VETERAGAFERAYVLDPSGSTANPEREAALRAKFRQLVGELKPSGTVQDLEAAVSRLDERPAAELLTLMAREA
jgi:hypothetical protein